MSISSFFRSYHKPGALGHPKSVFTHAESAEILSTDEIAPSSNIIDASSAFAERRQEVREVRFRKGACVLGGLTLAILISIGVKEASGQEASSSNETEFPTTTFGGQSICYLTIEEFPQEIQDEVIEFEHGFCYASDAPYVSTTAPSAVIPNPVKTNPGYTG